MIKKIQKMLQWKFIGFFLFLALFIRLFLLEGFLVLNSEMLPSVLKNDYVIVKKYSYGLSLPLVKNNILQYRSPKRGDVVLMRAPFSPHPMMLRRVIAVGGDRLFYSKGILYINEKAYPSKLPQGSLKKEFQFLNTIDFPGTFFLDETWERKVVEEIGEHWQETLWQKNKNKQSYSIFLDKDTSLSFGPYKIPDKHVFVMGDNRVSSRDSRNWPVQGSLAQGEVTFSRKSSKISSNSSPIIIPKGTKLIVLEDSFFPVFFETKHAVTIYQDEVRVAVQSQNVGLLGNVRAHTQWSMEDFPSLNVKNSKPFSGGQDFSLVPSSLIKGKVFMVLWGCQKPIEFLKFMCQFNSFRKGRWFWLVHQSD